MKVPNEKLPTIFHYPYPDKGIVLRGIKEKCGCSLTTCYWRADWKSLY
jgi:hypothetical protein